jgi:hypothetical protein
MKIVDVMEYLSYVIVSDKGKDRLNTLEGINGGHLPAATDELASSPQL